MEGEEGGLVGGVDERGKNERMKSKIVGIGGGLGGDEG